jgi:hypothetical protein
MSNLPSEHEARVAALADAIGVPAANVIPVLRGQLRRVPTHDENDNPLFYHVDSSSTDGTTRRRGLQEHRHHSKGGRTRIGPG